MKGMGIFRGGLVALAVLGFCLPQPLMAAGPPTDRASLLTDVALRADGVLVGQVVDPQGSARVNLPVSLLLLDREVARAQTDHQGRFAFHGLRSGVYQVVTAEGHWALRLWQQGTAPPCSQPGALLVTAQDTVRGQCGEPTCGETCAQPCAETCAEPCGGTCCEPCSPCCGGLRCCLCNPWIIAGIVATAVAVPVIIHNSHGPSSP